MHKKGTTFKKTWKHVEILRRIIFDLENHCRWKNAVPTTKGLRKMMKMKGINVCIRQIYRYLKILRDAKCIESSIKGCTRKTLPSRKGILIRKGTKLSKNYDGLHDGLQYEFKTYHGRRFRKFFKQRTLTSLRFQKAHNIEDDISKTKQMYTDAIVLIQQNQGLPIMSFIYQDESGGLEHQERVLKEIKAERLAAAQKKALAENKTVEQALKENVEIEQAKIWKSNLDLTRQSTTNIDEWWENKKKEEEAKRLEEEKFDNDLKAFLEERSKRF